MLQRMRDNMQGMVAKAVIGLIVITFALFGVDAIFQGSGVVEVAKVNELAITEFELSNAIQRQREQLLRRMGDNADFSALNDETLRDPVLQNLVNKKLLQDAAANNDIVVSERMIDKVILQDANFQENGRFSPELFDAVLRNNGWTPARYKEQLRRQLEASYLLSAYASTEFVTSVDMARAAEISGQKRDFEYAVLNRERASEYVSVADDEVKSWFDANADTYMTERQLAVDYIELRLEDYSEELEEEAIRAEYESSLEQEASSASQRRAAHILLTASDARSEEDTVALLAELQQKLSAGADFADLASEYSEDIVSGAMGGDLGYSSGDAFPEEFEQALAELELGQVSAPVATSAGWHLIKLTEIEGARVAPYEQVRDQIAAQLVRQEAEPRYAIVLEQLKDFSFNAPDLASVAEDLDLDIENSGFFSSDGANTGLFADSRLVLQAYSDFVVSEGANSEVVELSPGHAVVLRLRELKEPAPIPFDEVKEGIRARLLADKATEFINQRAQDILVAIKQGQLLSDLAESEKMAYKALSEQGRQPIEGVNPEILYSAFEQRLANDEPGYEVKSLTDGNIAVIVVSKVTAGTLAEFDVNAQQEMSRYLQRYRAESVVRAYQKSLKDSAEIEFM